MLSHCSGGRWSRAECSIVLVAGFAVLGTIDHETPLWFVGAAMFLVGVGVGMTVQNLVLAVQDSVPLKDIGAAGSSVAFFRFLGGTVWLAASEVRFR